MLGGYTYREERGGCGVGFGAGLVVPGEFGAGELSAFLCAEAGHGGGQVREGKAT